MTAEETKAAIQGAYERAIANHSIRFSPSSGIHHLFREVQLYGREAGADFIETNLAQIVKEAVATAKSKGSSLDLHLHGHGLAAIEGIIEALRDRTGLEVEASGHQIRLIWA